LGQIGAHVAGDGHGRAAIRIGAVPVAAVWRGGTTRALGEAGQAGLLANGRLRRRSARG
jgi:hypothetical protein